MDRVKKKQLRLYSVVQSLVLNVVHSSYQALAKSSKCLAGFTRISHELHGRSGYDMWWFKITHIMRVFEAGASTRTSNMKFPPNTIFRASACEALQRHLICPACHRLRVALLASSALKKSSVGIHVIFTPVQHAKLSSDHWKGTLSVSKKNLCRRRKWVGQMDVDEV